MVESADSAPSYSAQVRRIDVEFRSKFPHLVTRIFRVSIHDFIIVFDENMQNADEIRTEFDEQIRWVTVPVRISNNVPQTYYEELSPISDAEIGRDFAGMSLTTFAFENLVSARFPKLLLFGTQLISEPAQTINLRIDENTPTQLRDDLLHFCRGLGMPCCFALVESAGPPRQLSQGPLNNPMLVIATRSRGAVPRYVREDEALWFDKLDGVYSGNVAASDILGGTTASRCYLDFQIGRQVNIRQALLLYDVIYCTLPLATEHDRFLKEQGLKDDDLVTMVDRGRLRVLSVQPEERLRFRVLERLTEADPNSVIGRRRTALLLTADLVRTAGEYRLNDARLMKPLRDACEELGKELGRSPRELLGWMLWPVTALRASLPATHERASKGFPAIGVAGLVADLAKDSPHAVDWQFVSYVLSERVQLGHALEATVLPGLDDNDGSLGMMKLQGDLLNFYRAFNTRYTAAWIGEKNRKRNDSLTVPLMPFFEFMGDIPVSEFLDNVAHSSTRAKGRALMDRLAALPPEARTAEVSRLDKELRSKRARESGHMLSFESVDDAWGIISFITGFMGLPPAIAARNWGRRLREIARRNATLDGLIQSIEADVADSFGNTQDLDFLSRIDRVAHLQRPIIR